MQLVEHHKELLQELGAEFDFPEAKQRFHSTDSCSSDDDLSPEQALQPQRVVVGQISHLPRPTLLHEMVATDSIDRIAKQLDVGYGINTPDMGGMGETPLFWAVSKGVVDYLVGEGADIEWKNSLTGCSVFFKFASQGKHKPMKAIAAHLQKKGKLQEALGETAMFTNRTALHAAAINGYVATVRELLAFGADKNVKDAYGKTPAELAMTSGFDEVVSLLM